MAFVSAKRFRFAAFPVLVLCAALGAGGNARAETSPSPNVPHYSVADTVGLPGATRWDFLTFDPDKHHLFITRGENVDVMDVATKKIVGSIEKTHGAHGVALAPDLGRGFISDGAANTVTAFDLENLKPLATIKTGTKPDAIVYDRVTQRVFTANGESGDLTAINAKTDKAVGKIDLGGKPEFAVADGNGLLYVNLQDTAQIAVIDTKKLGLVTHIDLSLVCSGPTGLSIDRDRQRLFAACHNGVMVVVDAVAKKITDVLPIGTFSDATVFDAGVNLAFSSNSDGTLTVVGPAGANHYAVVQTVRTVPTARTMALDPATHTLYLAAAEPDGTIEEPTGKQDHPHPRMKPDSFRIVIVAPDNAGSK